MTDKAKKVSAHDFCVAWMQSETVAEVAEKTGLKPGTVSQRASALRSKGVPLKFFAKKSPRNDYNALAELVKGLESDDDTEARETREARKSSRNAVSEAEAEDFDDEDFDDEDFVDEDDE